MTAWLRPCSCICLAEGYLYKSRPPAAPAFACGVQGRAARRSPGRWPGAAAGGRLPPSGSVLRSPFRPANPLKAPLLCERGSSGSWSCPFALHSRRRSLWHSGSGLRVLLSQGQGGLTASRSYKPVAAAAEQLG